MPRTEERDVLIRRSKFLVEAEEALRGGRFDLACFLAERPLQLYPKARLLELTGESSTRGRTTSGSRWPGSSKRCPRAGRRPC